MKKYKFTGRTTSGIERYEYYGDCIMDIYSQLIDKGIIGDETMDNKRLSMAGLTMDDFCLEDGEVDYDKLQNFFEAAEYPEDIDVIEVINQENGNAYYQNFYKWNDELEEYEEIE